MSDTRDESFAFLIAYFRVYADFESPEAERDFLFATCIPLNHNVCYWGDNRPCECHHLVIINIALHF